MKFEVTGLLARAQSLTALGHKHEAIADNTCAVELARRAGDPLLFVRAASALLELDGNDDPAIEAHLSAERIAAALPNQRMCRSFESAEAVQVALR